MYVYCCSATIRAYICIYPPATGKYFTQCNLSQNQIVLKCLKLNSTLCV